MVVQGIKDRSKIREGMVTRKQGCGDEGETREDPDMGVCGERRDPREIQGRSIDLWGYGVQECRRRRNEGRGTT